MAARDLQPAPTCLLTGFEPFGGDRFNPSWEIAARLDGWQVQAQPAAAPAAAGAAATGRGEPSALAVVRSVRLPCVFDQSLAALDEALDRYRPVAVIALGLAASRAEISVERVAINVDDARIADNAGCQPIDRPVCPEGPVGYWSGLPVKAIVAALREAAIAAAVSQSAGTFVCNHVFYGLAHRMARRSERTRAGFIHVPWPRSSFCQADEAVGHAAVAAHPAPVVSRGGGHGPQTAAALDLGQAENAIVSVMDLDTLVEAIRIAIRVTLTAGDADLKLPGGTIA